MEDLESHHVPSRVDSAHLLPEFKQASGVSIAQQVQAIEASEASTFDISQLLQRENGAALSLVIQDTGESPHTSSMFNNWKSLVELLLRSGANPNLSTPSSDDPTPFAQFAAQYSNAVKRLPLWLHWVELLPVFLHHGANMNILFFSTSTTPCWYTRLFRMSSEHTRADEIFTLLFTHGLDPNRPYRSSTIWAFFLENILSNRTWNPQGVREYSLRSSPIYKTAKVFVQSGASLSCTIKGSLDEYKAFKQAWEALWPYGQEMQLLLKDSRGETRPKVLVDRLKGKERGSGGGNGLSEPLNI